LWNNSTLFQMIIEFKAQIFTSTTGSQKFNYIA
jgi:hypothetical protein